MTERGADPGGPHTYRISIAGALDAGWAARFDRMAVSYKRSADGKTITRLVGTLPDQAALRGVLSRVWDLNCTVLSVHTIEARVVPGQAQKGGMS